MTKINYINGDATAPVGEGVKIIPHVCNNINRWGAGFVMALSRKWDEPQKQYHQMSQHLGETRLVKVSEDIYVANMIGQSGTISPENPNPVDYNAIRIALMSVNQSAIRLGASIHAPKFGSDLAGSDWNIIEKIIEETMDVPVTVYIFN